MSNGRMDQFYCLDFHKFEELRISSRWNKWRYILLHLLITKPYTVHINWLNVNEPVSNAMKAEISIVFEKTGLV